MPLRIWLGVILLFLAAALLVGSAILAFAVYALILALALSLLTIHLSIRNISVERELSAVEANIGENLSVITKITNTSALPMLWVSAQDAIPEGLPVEGKHGEVVSLLPRRSRTFLYRVTLARRGYHRIGPLMAEAVDPFGFNRIFRAMPPDGYVTVYPKVIPLGGLAFPVLRRSGEVQIAHRAYEDPSRIRGVREYVRGDPLNRIHWKISAKLGKLHCKVYDPSTVSGITLALDFTRSNYAAEASEEGSESALERSELAVTLAASLVYDLLQQRMKAGLLTNGADAAERVKEEMRAREFSTRPDMESAAKERERARLGAIHVRASSAAAQSLRIIRTLARLELTDGPSLERVVFDETGHIARDTALVVIAPRVSSALAEKMAALRHSGMTVYLFLVSPYEKDIHSARMELAHFNIPIVQIGSENAISELAVSGRAAV
jgi:uncharacterized repeat protein (TIGR01451 family)